MTIFRTAVTSAIAGLALAGAALAAGSANAATEVIWWHAMGGELGQKVEKIANDFNATQSDYKVVPVYKGNYTETMTAAIAAFRAKEHPAIVQVFEVGTGTMMAAKGAVYPVFELMKAADEPFDPKAYLQAVVGYYADTDGNMLSMPFNSSTPILYYNKSVFEKAGLDPNTAPETWGDIETFSKKIIDSGAAPCGFTTGWQSWVQLENLSALHNVPFASRANGFGGTDAVLEFNGDLQTRHIADMGEWQKSKIFDYGGRRSDPAPKFYSGECAIYMNSSAALAGIRTNAKDFEVGVGMLPYYDDVKGAPQNSIIGGATLWVLSGHTDEEYKGTAKFFTYLSSPEVQAWWHEETGYLPITTAAYELAKSRGYYEKNPGADISVLQMNLNPPTENSRGLRLGNFVQIRDVINEELEEVWAGKKSAKEALDAAVERGNKLLREFQDQNS